MKTIDYNMKGIDKQYELYDENEVNKIYDCYKIIFNGLDAKNINVKEYLGLVNDRNRDKLYRFLTNNENEKINSYPFMASDFIEGDAKEFLEYSAKVKDLYDLYHREYIKDKDIPLLEKNIKPIIEKIKFEFLKIASHYKFKYGLTVGINSFLDEFVLSQYNIILDKSRKNKKFIIIVGHDYYPFLIFDKNLSLSNNSVFFLPNLKWGINNSYNDLVSYRNDVIYLFFNLVPDLRIETLLKEKIEDEDLIQCSKKTNGEFLAKEIYNYYTDQLFKLIESINQDWDLLGIMSWGDIVPKYILGRDNKLVNTSIFSGKKNRQLNSFKSIFKENAHKDITIKIRNKDTKFLIGYHPSNYSSFIKSHNYFMEFMRESNM